MKLTVETILNLPNKSLMGKTFTSYSSKELTAFLQEVDKVTENLFLITPQLEKLLIVYGMVVREIDWRKR